MKLRRKTKISQDFSVIQGVISSTIHDMKGW